MNFAKAPSDNPFSDPEARSGSFNGLVPVMNNAALEEEARNAAEKTNNTPMIQGLAGHVKKCFDAAKTERATAEQRMLANLRARRGEYDPETLAKIQKTGGSEVYMMIPSNKCRAATAWLRDTLLGNGVEKPWTVTTTKQPELPGDAQQQAIAKAGEIVQQLQEMLGGPQNVPDSQVEDLYKLAQARVEVEAKRTADAGMKRMESKMEDQLQEGGFLKAFSDVIDDISTFPSAFLKGPVVRNKPQMVWQQDASGEFTPVVENKLTLEWERVDPFNIYPAPGMTTINDGYLIEKHTMRPQQLEELIGVEGYNEAAIKEVIKAHGQGGLREWTTIDSAKALVEGKTSSSVSDMTSPTIDALQFWGTILGQDLLDFGMEPEKVPDATKTYHCEVWLIGSWVIKATLNYDVFGRKPYYKASYEELPGSFWGNAPPDLIADCVSLCNNAARAMANNMAIASGPQAVVNVDRVPPGEDITNIFPWKVWQTSTDLYGNNAAPVSFFQPSSLSQELMLIYERFASLADEYSGIPRYMTGDQNVGGAGRTASGMSMLMSNAGKSIKSVVFNIDMNIISPALERLFYYNMKYGTDPSLKRTDVKVVARGAASLVVKESAQVRRNEFLNICLSSPVVAGVIGEEAIADLLRTMASGLDMDTDKLIPPPEVIKARMFQQQQQALQQQQRQMQLAAAGVPPGAAPGTGAQQGPQVMPGNAQTLQDGAPITDTFAPSRG